MLIENGSKLYIDKTTTFQILATNLSFIATADGATTNQVSVNQMMELRVAEGTTLTFNTNGQAASIIRL